MRPQGLHPIFFDGPQRTNERARYFLLLAAQLFQLRQNIGRLHDMSKHYNSSAIIGGDFYNRH